jgi:hypothetical protein
MADPAPLDAASTKGDLMKPKVAGVITLEALADILNGPYRYGDRGTAALVTTDVHEWLRQTGVSADDRIAFLNRVQDGVHPTPVRAEDV